MHDQKLSYIYALSAVLLWSTVATAFKISLRYLTPEELLFYSSCSSLIVLSFLLIVKKMLGNAWRHIKKHFLYLIILGAINPFIYYLVLFKAYDILPAQEAQAINYTWALMLSYLSVIFLKHKLSRYDIFAGILAYLGVVIIATKGDVLSFHFSNTTGVILAILSTILWSFYWIFNTRSKADPIVGLFCSFLFGTFFIAIYLLFFKELHSINIKGLFSSVYVGFFEMGVTFILWLKALKYSENTSKTANLIFLSPVLSLFFIHYIAGEKIESSTILALFLIISGLTIQRVRSIR